MGYSEQHAPNRDMHDLSDMFLGFVTPLFRLLIITILYGQERARLGHSWNWSLEISLVQLLKRTRLELVSIYRGLNFQCFQTKPKA